MSIEGKVRGVSRILAGTRITVTPSHGQGDVTIGGGGHRILDEGTPLTDRADLDFVGAGVTVTDDAPNTKTVVTIPGGGGGSSLGEIAAKVTKTAVQSLTTATEAAVTFDSEEYDTDTFHDNVTNNTRLTFNRAGKFRVGAEVGFASNATGLRRIKIRKNGTTVLGTATVLAVSGQATYIGLVIDDDVVATDYVEVLAYQDSGGNLDVTTDTFFFTALLLQSAEIAVRVTKSATQALTTGTLTALTFNQEDYDTDTMHDNVTNNSRITVQRVGKYHITGHAKFAANSTGLRAVRIKKNGTTDIALTEVSATSAESMAIGVATDLSLAINDYIELIAYQTSGGNLNIETAETAFMAYLIK